MGLINALINPLKQLYAEFISFRESAIYRIDHTGSVEHIEKVLDDKFDNELRRIYLEQVTFSNYLWIFRPEDNEPLYLFNDDPEYLLEGSASLVAPDGTVWVPIAMKPVDESERILLEARIRACVDYYADFGINYQILYYE